MGLSRIRIAYRLPAAFLLIVALALGVLAAVSYRSARATLLVTGEEQLNGVARARVGELETWGASVETDLQMQARSPLLSNALQSFSAAWQVLGPDASVRLRQLFIEGPGLAPFQRQELSDPGDGSVYARVHERFHDHFRALMRRGDYRDIYLFDSKGNMVYSVAKQDDFARTTEAGKGDVFLSGVGEMLNSGKEGQSRFIDFQEYGTLGEMSAFVLAPVMAFDGSVLGVVAFRMNLMTVTAKVGSTGGLGASGQVFVIGSDGRARSEAEGWKGGALSESSPLAPALQGESGVTMEDLPESALSGLMTAFAPARVFGSTWIVIVSEKTDELLLAVARFSRMMMLYGAITLVGAAAVGLLIALGVTLPLRAVARSIENVREEIYDAPVPHVARRDEIGEIGRSIEALRARLSDAAALTHEMSFKSAALESTSAALMITDSDFTITYMNEAVRRMMRNQVQEFRKISKSFDADGLIGVNMDIFHAKPAQIRALVQEPGKLPFRTDIRVGAARIQIELNAVYGPDGDFAGLVVEWVDVTEERRKTAVLSAIEKGQIMADFDMTGRFTRANNNFVVLAASSAEALSDLDLSDLAIFEGDLPSGEGMLDTLRRGDPVQGRFRIRRRDGGEALVEGGLYPVFDRRGETTGASLIGSDVTAAQAELRSAEARQHAMQEAQRSVVEALSVGMRDISRGDLTSRLTAAFAPEYEQLRSDFNDALENLTQAMRNVASQTSAMHHETSEIVKAADEMSVRTERQAMTLQETASSLDELTTNITQTANGAARANEVVTEARARAEESGGVVDEAERAMAEIAASSQEIVKVISVIDDISFQTNLLALNAGVEAARAGEAGRGFAVVATEVRALAQRCANAAAEINQLITVSGQHVSRGVELVGVTGETLKKIVASISEISDYIAEIAQAGKEQSVGLGQVNSAVNQIDHVTQQNAAMFEETTSASHALAQRANSLSETIGHFRIGDAPAPAARGPKTARKPARRNSETRGNLALARDKAPEASGWEDF
ncbi:HAMP domain-containing protein [Pseudooceanicola sp. CBS1P-1]|uniref:HAMP domain-containing protein n=1 Tax=Pseudooceanicola albus TaxID=2692189 RepID=A0A6L7G0D0_9RHOB|nr:MULTISPECIES: methyl-accepting chemotaxis protein [Pseudooceanicola]MBT9383681.1 HAMP domain-containing protein [Pseudooceanicola endophyticus]MXN17535.1 HAMP domain-containing protein [Pseudooceanicola albus]